MDYSQIEGWKLLAGLGLFLFGMSFLEEGIKAISGREFKKFLQHQTGNPVKAVIAGALTTGVMQSSSVVTLLVMSFTGAGIIGLKSGIGMILGANLGTTVTGWVVALLGFKINLESLYLPIISIGSLIFIFSNKGKLHQVGSILFGFGLMFMGLHFMKDGFMKFAVTSDLSLLAGKPAVLFILFGFVLAASIRSSSAAMMIFLASLSSGSISLMQAGYLAIGADIGTTMTGLLGTINGNAIRKKTGWAQFVINIITAVFTLILIHPLFYAISKVGIKDPLIALVTFHSSFNLLGIILILPYLSLITKLLDTYISGDTKSISRFIPFVNTRDNMMALDALGNECKFFIEKAVSCRNSFFIDKQATHPNDLYFELKSYENEIFSFGSAVMENKLTETEAKSIQLVFSSIRSSTLSVKDVKDIEHNLIEFSQSSSEIIFQFIEILIQEQKIFDLQFQSNVLNRNNIDEELIQDLFNEIDMKYESSKSKALNIYRASPDFDLASMLNMIRELRDSSKLLLTSYNQYAENQLIINKR